jgi:hypothetical protein
MVAPRVGSQPSTHIHLARRSNARTRQRLHTPSCVLRPETGHPSMHAAANGHKLGRGGAARVWMDGWMGGRPRAGDGPHLLGEIRSGSGTMVPLVQRAMRSSTSFCTWRTSEMPTFSSSFDRIDGTCHAHTSVRAGWGVSVSVCARVCVSGARAVSQWVAATRAGARLPPDDPGSGASSPRTLPHLLQ